MVNFVVIVMTPFVVQSNELMKVLSLFWWLVLIAFGLITFNHGW